MNVPNQIQFRIPRGQLLKAQASLGALLAQYPGLYQLEMRHYLGDLVYHPCAHDDGACVYGKADFLLGDDDTADCGIGPEQCNCAPHCTLHVHDDNPGLVSALQAWVASNT